MGIFDAIKSFILAALSPFFVKVEGYAPKKAVDYGVQFGVVYSSSAVDLDTLARTLWGEARGTGAQGMQAVANVVINRFRLRAQGLGYPSFGRKGASIAEICRAPYQFSAWNYNDPNLPLLKKVTDKDVQFRQALAIAEQALRGALPDITGGADHYHTTAVAPDWAIGKVPTAQIGTHKFYRIAAPPVKVYA